jgi:integrase
MKKTQQGSLKKIGKSWFARWREDVISDGTTRDYRKGVVPKGDIARVQRNAKICDFDDRYRSKKTYVLCWRTGSERPGETHATTPEEVMEILELLEGAKDVKPRYKIQAQVAIGLVYFAGLRPGEARGARWEDYNGKTLRVKQSVWRKHTTAPKTEHAAKPVPVIEPLRELLAELRTLEGNPAIGPILQGVSGKPLNLDMLAREVIMPAVRKPENYASADAKRLTWHGYYAFRRGIATLTSSVAHDPMAAKGLLRHTSVSTTLAHYIKDVPEVTENAMTLVEELFTKPVAPEIIQ